MHKIILTVACQIEWESGPCLLKVPEGTDRLGTRLGQSDAEPGSTYKHA